MDDSNIVELFLQRDEEAIRQSEEKYGKRLFSLANGIVQDIQLRLYRNGYVRFQGLLDICVQLPEESFRAFTDMLE